MKKVWMCVCTKDGKQQAEIAAWMVRLDRLWQHTEQAWELDFYWVFNAEPVEWARNCAVEAFLKTGNDVLWFVDADMLPLPTSHTILDFGADIVAGPCPMMKEDSKGELGVRPNLYSGDLDLTGFKIWQPGETPIAAGTANMTIARRVLEDPKMRCNGGGVFRRVYGDMGQVMVGEDVDFCVRAQKQGYTFEVAYDAQMGHVKPVDLDEAFTNMKKQVERGMAFRAQNG